MPIQSANRSCFGSLVLTLGALLVLISSGCAHRDSTVDHRILGEWKSNRELSIATLSYPSAAKPEHIAALEALFGRLSIRYDHGSYRAVMPASDTAPEWVYEADYKIIEHDETGMVIRSRDTLESEPSDERITFEGNDRYWIPLEQLHGREYFDRIK